MRPAKALSGLLAVVASAAVLSACHDSGSGSATTGSGKKAPAKPGPDKKRPPAVIADLVITGFPGGGADNTSVELSCSRQGYPHIDKALRRACESIRTDPKMFEPTAKDVACTQIYGGPERALVAGTVNGDKIDAEFSRTNGCEIARWNRAKYLLELVVPPTAATGVQPVDVIIG